MRRSVTLLLTVMLTLASALALLRAAALVDDVPGGSDQAIANELLVLRYYAAANALIATGKPGGLEAVVDNELLVHLGMPEAGAELGREGLVGRLHAIHSAQPDLRLVVRRIIADEDIVVARLAIAGASPGLPPAVRPSRFEEDWLDGFRIRRGKITAMWGATSGLSAPASVLSAEVDVLGASAFVGLTRLTLAPHEEPPVLVGPGPMLVVPESGSLRARIDGSGQLTRFEAGVAIVESTARGRPVAIGPGEHLTLRAGVTIRLDSNGGTPAVALVAVVWPPSAAEPNAFTNSGLSPRLLVEEMFPTTGDDAPERDDRPGGASWQPLVIGTVPVPAGRVRLGVERLVVAPGGVIPAFRPAGAALLGVERGTAVVSVVSGSGDEPAMASTLVGGGTTPLQAGIGATIRNVGDAPATVAAITVLAASVDDEPT